MPMYRFCPEGREAAVATADKPNRSSRAATTAPTRGHMSNRYGLFFRGHDDCARGERAVVVSHSSCASNWALLVANA